MSVDWSDGAQANLEAILTHVAEDNPTAARELVTQIVRRTETVLTDNPHAGRQGRVEGTREWVAHKRYIVVYRVTASGQVQVATVRHTSPRWPTTI